MKEMLRVFSLPSWLLCLMIEIFSKNLLWIWYYYLSQIGFVSPILMENYFHDFLDFINIKLLKEDINGNESVLLQ